jgi:hypothetical protein
MIGPAMLPRVDVDLIRPNEFSCGFIAGTRPVARLATSQRNFIFESRAV